MYTIEIYNSAMQLQAISENHQSIEWTRKFRGLGTFEMVINENMPEVQYISKGGHIVIRKDGAYEAGGIIDYVAKQIDESGYAGEEVIVKGNTWTGSSYGESACLRMDPHTMRTRMQPNLSLRLWWQRTSSLRRMPTEPYQTL